MYFLQTGVCQYTIEVCPIIDSNYSRVRLKRKLSTGATSRSFRFPISSNERNLFFLANSTNNSNIINAPIIVDQLVLEDRVACYVRVLALSLNQMCELEIRQRSSSGASFLISPWQNRLNTFKSLHKRCVLSYNQWKRNTKPKFFISFFFTFLFWEIHHSFRKILFSFWHIFFFCDEQRLSNMTLDKSIINLNNKSLKFIIFSFLTLLISFLLFVCCSNTSSCCSQEVDTR